MIRNNDHIVLSIAGFDPCAGAGVLADTQTFARHHVQGMAVNTSLTSQDENKVYGVEWLSWKQIKFQLNPLIDFYNILYIKIGLIESLERLSGLLDFLRERCPKAMIIWDPIIKSSSGFDILKKDQTNLNKVISQLDLITPNLPEYNWLKNQSNDLSTVNLLVKGGHRDGEDTSDILKESNGRETIIKGHRINGVDKHGTGCILSASILSHLSLGAPIVEACKDAKKYIESYLETSDTKLGKHYAISI